MVSKIGTVANVISFLVIFCASLFLHFVLFWPFALVFSASVYLSSFPGHFSDVQTLVAFLLQNFQNILDATVGLALLMSLCKLFLKYSEGGEDRR